MIASSFQAPSSKASSSAASDGMLSISLARPQIRQIIENFLSHSDDNENEVGKDGISVDTRRLTVLLLDEVLIDFGCKYRIVVQKCAEVKTSLHVGPSKDTGVIPSMTAFSNF
eukprot:CAMPEP_0197232640 /NCGR_PEP_ID=MMETSP1429-20130617/893_1 /TAXON_ID=49237 /ORGANISM="Chaetoceros  sp., Strain UNC1202" /LENGTH=112 /DNA_ID=CAMNT_0042690723 /DNA_START=110 /DNA_END=448 /DNA_ORIENTATION=-